MLCISWSNTTSGFVFLSEFFRLTSSAWSQTSTVAITPTSGLYVSIQKTKTESLDHPTTARYDLPDSKIHGVNMGPIWVRQDPGGPLIGLMNFVIWAYTCQVYVFAFATLITVFVLVYTYLPIFLNQSPLPIHTHARTYTHAYEQVRMHTHHADTNGGWCWTQNLTSNI